MDAGGEHRLAAALLLEPILRATGDAARLATVLAIRIEHAGEPAGAVALLHELAWIEERELGRRDDAFATLARALRADPSHTPTFDALEALTGDGGDWERAGDAVQGDRGAPAQHRRARRGALPPRRALPRSPTRRRAGAAHLLARARSGARASGGRARHRRAARRRRTARRARRASRRGAGATSRRRRRGPQEARARRALRARARRRQRGRRALRCDPWPATATRRRRYAGLERLFAAGVERQRVAALLDAVVSESGRAADLGAHLDGGARRGARGAAARGADRADGAGALGRAARRARRCARAGHRAHRRRRRRAHRCAWRSPGSSASVAPPPRPRRCSCACSPTTPAAPGGVARARRALWPPTARHADRVDVLASPRRARGARSAARAPVVAGRAAGDALGDTGGARATLAAALDARPDERVLRALARLADDDDGDDAVAVVVRRRARRRRGAHRAGRALRASRSLARAGRMLDRQLAAASAEAAPALVEQLALLRTRLSSARRPRRRGGG